VWAPPPASALQAVPRNKFELRCSASAFSAAACVLWYASAFALANDTRVSLRVGATDAARVRAAYRLMFSARQVRPVVLCSVM